MCRSVSKQLHNPKQCLTQLRAHLRSSVSLNEDDTLMTNHVTRTLHMVLRTPTHMSTTNRLEFNKPYHIHDNIWTNKIYREIQQIFTWIWVQSFIFVKSKIIQLAFYIDEKQDARPCSYVKQNPCLVLGQSQPKQYKTQKTCSSQSYWKVNLDIVRDILQRRSTNSNTINCQSHASKPCVFMCFHS